VTCQDDSEPWTVDLPIAGAPVTFKIDTGADISIMDYITYKGLPRKPPITPTDAKLNSPGGPVTAIGEFQAVTQFRGNTYEFRTIVVDRPGSNLLSRSVSVKTGLIPDGPCLEEIQNDIYGTAEKIGLMSTDPVQIKLREDASPHCMYIARKVPFPQMEAVKTELDRMVKNGVIRPITEPTEWCAPMVPVVKKNGKLRICVDLKRLNKAVRREHYSLPNLEDVAPKLAGSTVFSTLDAASGFWQIPLEENSQKLTTFITPFGRFAFQRIPFGITSAPEIFQGEMIELLRGHEGTEVIMDDILVHGKTVEEHDHRLAQVLTTIRESGLRLNKDKCNIRQRELTYFGHRVGVNGIKPDPEISA
jgi:hypothetical protein